MWPQVRARVSPVWPHQRPRRQQAHCEPLVRCQRHWRRVARGVRVCGGWAPLQVCGVQGPRPLAAASVDICVDTRTWKSTGCRRTRLLAAASVGICVDTHTWKCAGCRRPRLRARCSVGVRIIVEARVSLPIENARWVAVAAPPTPAAAAAAAAAGSSPMTRMPPRLHGRRGGGS